MATIRVAAALTALALGVAVGELRSQKIAHDSNREDTQAKIVRAFIGGTCKHHRECNRC